MIPQTVVLEGVTLVTPPLAASVAVALAVTPGAGAVEIASVGVAV